MKTAIDQFILDKIPIRIFTDYTFFGSYIQRSSYFHWYFSMVNNSKECAGLKQIELSVFKYILN